MRKKVNVKKKKREGKIISLFYKVLPMKFFKKMN